MLFSTFDYMQWAKIEPDESVRFNLASSGFTYVDPAVIRPDLSKVELFSTRGYGSPEIARRVAERYRVPVDHVFPASGTSLGVFLAMAAALDTGDEVLVEQPAYGPLFKVPESLGIGVRRFARPFENGYAVDPDHVRSLLTPKTKLIAISDLHNPTGRALPPEVMKALVSLAESRGLVIFVDEVYRDFRDGGPGTWYEPGAPVIAASSLTKVYGMGGLRAGWMLGAPAVVKNAAHVMDLLHVNDAYPVMPFVQAAFDRADELRERGLRVSREGRGILEAWIKTRPDLDWSPPDAGLTAFVRLPEGLTGTQVSETLKRDESTLVVPGRFFEDDRFIRIGVGNGTEVLRGGLERLGKTLDRLRS